MGKVANRYLAIDAWRLVEEGFHPERSRASESLFSLANEHMGVRGYFEEGYSGDTLRGAYVSGVLGEHFVSEPSAYRGVSNRICFLVNGVDWLYTRIQLGDEILDLASSAFSGFHRELDFRTGELRRALVWKARSGAELAVDFSRFLSLDAPELGMQRVSLTALNFSGPVTLTLGLDFAAVHEAYGRNFWNCPSRAAAPDEFGILGVVEGTGHKLFAGFRLASPVVEAVEPIESDRFVGARLTLQLERAAPRAVDRAAILWTTRRAADPEQTVRAEGMRRLRELRTVDYDATLRNTSACWARFWERSDIEIDGDPETQQGIRFCLFQLHQTYRGAVPGSNIGAKGLSGEAYNGNAFWDTETYCLPFYLFSDPAAARALIEFRHRTLAQAIARARELDCDGACFPIATSDGTESCTLWQHASLQLQPTTAVAYAIAHYTRVTGEDAFLRRPGLELLVQICRFLASRGQWSPRRGTFGYYGVMGPDEFQLMVNNNCYTNFMARETFRFTLAAVDELRTGDAAGTDELLGRLGCSDDELAGWRRMADAMFIPYDPATMLFEQHEGFFDLPHVDVDAIPVDEFPLYDHWAYDRIYRNDMVKQPDVLMFLFLYSGAFSAEQKRANYDYYEPRCIHESSLSPSIHSILAAELGRPAEAFEFFRFATRIDIDDYNRNVDEGIHMTSIAAAWMNIVYGFGGLRSDGALLTLDPTIPAHWRSYSFRLAYRGSLLRIAVTPQGAALSLVGGPPVRLVARGTEIEVGAAGAWLPAPGATA